MGLFKRNFSKIIFCLVALSFSLGLIPSTFAWFDGKVNIDLTPISGETEGSYFAGGDGSEENPYLITKPIHIYNLSWLQYLGHFNKNDGSSSLTQYYFQIENDIDMEGMTIPPIGTSDNPFIGNFNGQNYIISNFEISNSFSDYEKKPSLITSLDEINIVGFFGVIGSLPTSSFTYDSMINEVYNLGLYDFSVSTKSSTSLIGLAAGYVNGSVSGVAVNSGNLNIKQNSSPITSLTNNLSNFGTVGYCTPSFLSTCEVKDVSVTDPSVANLSIVDGGDEWGASIAMKKMYDNIREHWDNNNANKYYVNTQVNREYDVDGNLISESKGNPRAIYVDSNLSPTFSSQTYQPRYEEVLEENDKIASYSYSYRDGTDDYMYLYGKTTFNLPGAVNVDNNGYFSYGTIFSDGNGNFLSNNGTTITNSINLNSATSYFYNEDTGYLTTYINSTTYRLYFNGSSLSLSTTNNPTVFIIEDGKLYCEYNDNVYSLYFNGTNWIMSLNEVSDYFYIKANGSENYLRVTFTDQNQTTGTIANTTNKSNATKWYIDNNNNVYTINGTNNIYIGANTTTLQAKTNPSNKYLYNGTTLSYTSQSIIYRTTYYLRYNNNSWSSSRTSSTFETSYDISGNSTELNESQGTKIPVKETIQTTEDGTVTTEPCYIPLLWNEDYTSVNEKNTGYLVAGANYSVLQGDIRVSRYENGYIYKSAGNNRNSGFNYNDTADSKLQIITRNANSNGFTVIRDSHNNSNFSNVYNSLRNATTTYKTEEELGFEKYADSRNAIEDVLKESTNNIYGLHFMDAQISRSRLVNIPKATVNCFENSERDDKTYYNYEVPEDCIDFNLKKKGFINFFAGTYFSGNTAFFSLHEIDRDSSHQIIDIKEIESIYLRTDYIDNPSTPYVYKYKNQAVPSNAGNLLFETSWITSPAMVEYALYYFEMPVNGGEYALGSVPNKSGAYLIYLDIGTGTKAVDETTISEKIEIRTIQYEFPKGIDFAIIVPLPDEDFENIKGGKVATVTLNGSTSGNISLLYENNTLTVGIPTSGSISSTFKGEGILIKNTNNQEIEPNYTYIGKQIIIKTLVNSYNENDLTFTIDTTTETTSYSASDVIIDTNVENSISTQTGVMENPYEGVEEYISVSQTIVKFNYYVKEGVNITFTLTFNPMLNEYILEYFSDSDVTLTIKIDPSVIIPQKYNIRLANISGSPIIEAGQSYTFTISN